MRSLSRFFSFVQCPWCCGLESWFVRLSTLSVPIYIPNNPPRHPTHSPSQPNHHPIPCPSPIATQLNYIFYDIFQQPDTQITDVRHWTNMNKKVNGDYLTLLTVIWTSNVALNLIYYERCKSQHGLSRPLVTSSIVTANSVNSVRAQGRIGEEKRRWHCYLRGNLNFLSVFSLSRGSSSTKNNWAKKAVD